MPTTGLPTVDEVSAEPLRALLSPGVTEHPFYSPAWCQWLRQTLAERVARAAQGRWELDHIPELAALCTLDPEFVPTGSQGRTWGKPELASPEHVWLNPEKVVDAMLEIWHYGRAKRMFKAAALSLADREHEEPEVWWAHDFSFGVYRAFLRACRANTARYLDEHGITEVWLWRGENVHAGQPWGLDPLTLWTPFGRMAWRYARWSRADRVRGGRLILARVPADRIFSTGATGIGQPHLGEVVVDGLGGPIAAWHWSIPGPEMMLAEPLDDELEDLLLGSGDLSWSTLAARYDPRQPPYPFMPLRSPRPGVRTAPVG